MFHSPPGTGKTLLARALAGTYRFNGQGPSVSLHAYIRWLARPRAHARIQPSSCTRVQTTYPNGGRMPTPSPLRKSPLLPASIIFFDEIGGRAARALLKTRPDSPIVDRVDPSHAPGRHGRLRASCHLWRYESPGCGGSRSEMARKVR